MDTLPALLAGVDEAGRGCLAGPVVAASVILPPRYELNGLADSKLLSPATRVRLEEEIKTTAVAWSLGLAWPREIERINILQASLLAMRRAVLKLATGPELILVDGNQSLPLDIPTRCIAGGDRLVPAISAASILAKTFRDRLMSRLDHKYPGYGFSENKGYGTAAHVRSLRWLGPCRLHRRTFKPVRELTGERRPCLPGIFDKDR